MSPSSPTSFPPSVTFHSDWGVTTGTGVAGGVDSVVEKDERGLPIVRATVLAGVVLPAYAGMIPRPGLVCGLPGGAPRVCGDDPYADWQRNYSKLCSPRMRG